MKELLVIKQRINEKLYRLGQHQKTLQDMENSIAKKYEKMKKEMAVLINKEEKEIKQLEEEIKNLVQPYQQALIKEADKKTIQLRFGKISWRFTPLSVNIRNTAKVIQSLKEEKLTHLIRTKEEIDKEMILKKLNKIKDRLEIIDGLSISQKEELIIEPVLSNKQFIKKIRKIKII